MARRVCPFAEDCGQARAMVRRGHDADIPRGAFRLIEGSTESRTASKRRFAEGNSGLASTLVPGSPFCS